MAELTEDLDKLSKEVRQIADEIAALKVKKNKMEHGPERKSLNREIRSKQYQALFYMDKIENISRQKKQ